MKTRVATMGQRSLWEGNLPPLVEGMRLVLGEGCWMVKRAFVHLDGKTPMQVLYVDESTAHEPGLLDKRCTR